MCPRVGDRVRVTGVMPNDPCPLEVGAEGTVIGIFPGLYGIKQIDVGWDNGRSLFLLSTDPFTIVRSES